jgi:chitinase
MRFTSIFALVPVVLTGGCCHVGPSDRAEPSPRFRVVGYLPEYQMGHFDPSMGRYTTDIIFFSVEPTASGELDASRILPEHIEQLQAAKKEHGTALSVAIGGWGRSDGFGPMATNPTARARFVQVLKDFCLTNDFDGADYDWEFPKDAAERKAYSALLMETKRAFKPHGFSVTVALNKWQRLDDDAYAAIDRLHFMAYDDGIRHSTLANGQRAVEAFLKAGVPAHKICLGVPFYGRKMEDRDVAASYADILRDYAPASDQDEAGGFYFNGIATMKEKTRYAQSADLGGVMIWELGQDAPGDASLLRAIHDAVSERP